METPKIYTNNLKEGIITMEMLGASLYSVNKRAKNCRDQRRSYSRSSWYHADRAAEKYEQKMEDYYDMKDYLLDIVKPSCIHTVVRHCRWGGERQEYFLFYRVGNYSFHHPVDEEQLGNYSELPIKDIGSLSTFGTCTNDLISVQFVRKLCNLIDTKEYVLVV